MYAQRQQALRCAALRNRPAPAATLERRRRAGGGTTQEDGGVGEGGGSACESRRGLLEMRPWLLANR